MGDLEDLIIKLEYKAALEVLWPLPAYDKERFKQMFEIAYFYNESGHFRTAFSIITKIRNASTNTTPVITENLPPLKDYKVRDQIRNTLEQIDPAYFAQLNMRYFPQFVLVETGLYKTSGDSNGFEIDSFGLSQTQITNWQFALFCQWNERKMRTYSPVWGLAGDKPVVNINWYDAIAYSNWLSEFCLLRPCYHINRDQRDPNNENKFDQIAWNVRVDSQANGFRLPVEAEWEYAAQGGHNSNAYRYAGSNDLREVGWFMENTDHPQAVATKKKNEIGLYDMSGNVWEWCWNWYKDDFLGKLYEENGTYRTMRGGSWMDGEDLCTVTNRNYGNPHVRDHSYGLRVVR